MNTPLQTYPEDTKSATGLINPAHKLLNTGGTPIVTVSPALVNTGALVSGGATLVNSGTLINAGILVNSGALVQDPATGALYLQGGTTQVLQNPQALAPQALNPQALSPQALAPHSPASILQSHAASSGLPANLISPAATNILTQPTLARADPPTTSPLGPPPVVSDSDNDVPSTMLKNDPDDLSNMPLDLEAIIESPVKDEEEEDLPLMDFQDPGTGIR